MTTMASKRSKHREIEVTCDFPGCGKKFRRLDHLSRHKVNHSSTTYPCELCGKSFKRQDVLSLHKARHARDGSDGSTFPSSASLSATTVSKPPRTTANAASPPSILVLDSEQVPPSQVEPAPPSPGPCLVDQSLSHAGSCSLDSIPVADDPSVPTFDWGYYGLSEQPDWDSLLAVLGDSQPFGDDEGGGGGSSFGWTPLPHPGHSASVDVEMLQGGNEEETNALDSSILMEKKGEVRNEVEEQGYDPTSRNRLQFVERHPSVTVSETARLKLLEEIPDFLLLGTKNPLSLSASHLNAALESYWDRFDPQVPIVHRGTFDPEKSNPLLLAIMIIIGSYYLPTPDTTFSGISLTIRARLVLSLTPNLPTPVFQTFVLCHIFDDYMSTSAAHFSAQVFSSVLIAVTRRNGLMVQRNIGINQNDTVEDQWKAWVDQQSTIRTAYSLHFLDALLPVAWGQSCSRRQGIFATRLPIPCSAGEWNARTSHSWRQAHTVVSVSTNDEEGTVDPDIHYTPAFEPAYMPSIAPPGFSQSLKSALNIKETCSGSENPWTRTLLLLGLTTIAWDLQTRGSSGVLFQDGLRREWRVPLRAAFLRLNDHAWDPEAPRTAIGLNRDIAALSIISLLSDVISLQIFCGMSVVAGCSVGPEQKSAARVKLSRWAHGIDGGPAAWHAAEYLEDFYTDYVDQPPSLATAWAVFVATIATLSFSLLAIPHAVKGFKSAPCRPEDNRKVRPVPEALLMT
ncbi:hypothetical protein T439DRAFT_178199 [Meredithblackwellia eburnea MCA 4105]